MSMKKLKRVLPFSLAIILASVSLPVTALADSAKVVTLGANLSDEQKASMLPDLQLKYPEPVH